MVRKYFRWMFGWRERRKKNWWSLDIFTLNLPKFFLPEKEKGKKKGRKCSWLERTKIPMCKVLTVLLFASLHLSFYFIFFPVDFCLFDSLLYYLSHVFSSTLVFVFSYTSHSFLFFFFFIIFFCFSGILFVSVFFFFILFFFVFSYTFFFHLPLACSLYKKIK